MDSLSCTLGPIYMAIIGRRLQHRVTLLQTAMKLTISSTNTLVLSEHLHVRVLIKQLEEMIDR